MESDPALAELSGDTSSVNLGADDVEKSLDDVEDGEVLASESSVAESVTLEDVEIGEMEFVDVSSIMDDIVDSVVERCADMMEADESQGDSEIEVAANPTPRIKVRSLHQSLFLGTLHH
jgi:hypothetical protein